MAKKVLVSIPDYRTRCRPALDMLKAAGFEVIEYAGDKMMAAEEIKKVGKDIFGCIIGSEVWDKDVFEACPELKIIARHGVGYDNIDLIEAKKRGIKVSIATGANADSVAEFTLMHVLSVLRNLAYLDRTTREEKWERYTGRSLHGKTYGLVGFGAIARYVAKLLGSFDLKKIYAYDLIPNHDAAAKLGVEMTDLSTVFKESDVISLHIPNSPENTGLINEKIFKTMKRNAILINVARGPVVDEKALYTALKEKWIAGAGLDVFAVEPISKDNPLLTLDNVTVTPHLAGDTVETFIAVSNFNAQTVIDVYNGKDPQNWINK